MEKDNTEGAKLPEYDADTLTALQASIQHWKDIEAGVEDELGYSNCALCQRFNIIGEIPRCTGCPVYKKTGHRVCRNTPYTDWAVAIRRIVPVKRTAVTKELIDIAHKEVEFLESLLPPMKKLHVFKQYQIVRYTPVGAWARNLWRKPGTLATVVENSHADRKTTLVQFYNESHPINAMTENLTLYTRD